MILLLVLVSGEGKSDKKKAWKWVTRHTWFLEILNFFPRLENWKFLRRSKLKVFEKQFPNSFSASKFTDNFSCATGIEQTSERMHFRNHSIGALAWIRKIIENCNMHEVPLRSFKIPRFSLFNCLQSMSAKLLIICFVRHETLLWSSFGFTQILFPQRRFLSIALKPSQKSRWKRIKNSILKIAYSLEVAQELKNIIELLLILHVWKF